MTTNETKRTEGELEVTLYTAFDDVEVYHLSDSDGCMIAGDVDKPDATHLAACWNACEGINPEAVPMILEALKATKAAYASQQLYDKCPLPLIQAALAKAEEKS